MFHFRRFRTRVLVLVTSLVALVQGVSWWAVAHANRKNASRHIEQSMRDGVLDFGEFMKTRRHMLTAGAGLLAGDLALRYAIDRDDRRTIRSVLDHYVQRLDIAGMAVFSGTGDLLAISPETAGEPTRNLLASLARGWPTRDKELTHDPILALDGEKLLVVLVADIEVAREMPGGARLVVAHRIDREFVDRIKHQTRLDVTLLTSGASPRILASTLEDDAFVPRNPDLVNRMQVEPGPDGPLLLWSLPITLLDGQEAHLVLQRSLEDEIAPVRWLEHLLAVTFTVSIAGAVFLAILLARNVSRPVQQLARHTRVIARGDYATRIPWKRADELGRLANALNTMSEGLAERDQVRDLLDKNVSPEVAARLIRHGAVLSGEERTVTILFVDLRGFTAISEQLAPADLFALLNRFLDTMSAEIESRGGIIDKYIGDEIMALFGAPLDMPDAPDRAVQAALAMRAALPALNAALAAENLPEVDFGIGICTASVLAGNIGSRRRLNYSVIGDGVNLAARLQALTRREDWHASILISDTTRAALRDPSACHLRELGEIAVKGKTAPVRIHAVDA
ncbi:guanylate cyclase [Opitutaceae bacterium TAV5]|nr:guanylate cyclase [Opitutaceae bacterium TAV5]